MLSLNRCVRCVKLDLLFNTFAVSILDSIFRNRYGIEGHRLLCIYATKDNISELKRYNMETQLQ